MIKVQCPSCGVQLSAPPEYAGRTVSCQQCKNKFVVPDSDPALVPPAPAAAAEPAKPPKPQFKMAQPPQPAFAVADPVAPDPGIGIRTRTSRNIELLESHAWRDIFDFRFSRFLTPKIIRLVYILAMLAALIYFCIMTFIFFVGLVGSTSDLGANQNWHNRLAASEYPSAVDNEALNRVITDQPNQLAMIGDPGPLLGQFERSNTAVGTAILFMFLVYLASVAGLLLGLLLVRLLLEALLIQFHNGQRLAAIEAKK